MNYYAFWISEIIQGLTTGKASAKKVEIAAEDYMSGLLNFVQKYGKNYEITINGLSNSEKTLDLKGESITVTCNSIKIINHVIVQNGTLTISPARDSALIRTHLKNIRVSFQSDYDCQLVISGAICDDVSFEGDGILFDGPVEGDYTIDKKEDNAEETKTGVQNNTAVKTKISSGIDIPLEVFNKLSVKLGTKDTARILAAYKKLRHKIA